MFYKTNIINIIYLIELYFDNKLRECQNVKQTRANKKMCNKKKKQSVTNLNFHNTRSHQLIFFFQCSSFQICQCFFELCCHCICLQIARLLLFCCFLTILNRHHTNIIKRREKHYKKQYICIIEKQDSNNNIN
jgi:hypothetical protein